MKDHTEVTLAGKEVDDRDLLAPRQGDRAAAEGAADRAGRQVEALRERARLLNLAQCGDFEELFMQELFLRPMGMAT